MLRFKKRKKVLVYTIGCTRRELDTSKLMRYFKLNNCDIIGNPTNADYIILVTCSFRKVKEYLSIELAKAFAQCKGQMIVLGCLPATAPNKLKEQVKCKSLATKDLNSIDKFFPDFKIKFSDIPEVNFKTYASIFTLLFFLKREIRFSKKFIVSFMNFTKVFLKECIYSHKRSAFSQKTLIRISGGCLGNCSYCEIKNAVGKLKSKPLKNIIDEYKKLLNEGYSNFSMEGEDVGAYGLDIQSSFRELLEQLSKVDKNFNVSWFIKDLNPQWFIRYKKTILEWIKSNRIKYIEVPIQSGSHRILKLMNRYTNLTVLLHSLQDIKRINSKVTLITHIIIGFPTENEKDFIKTLNFIKKCGVSEVIIFRYYDVESSRSFHFKGKVSKEEAIKRLEIAKNFLSRNKIKYYYDEDFYETGYTLLNCFH